MQLAGNTILITGGATGIGFAMAEAFLNAGSTVIICGRREARLAEAKAKHPTLHTFACDVASEAGRKMALDRISAEFPQLNVLVNNAGLQRDIDFTDGIGDFLGGENEIRVNLESPIVLCGLLIPLLAKNRNPVIINVSSGLGFIPSAQMPVYSASKAGMHAFTMAIRQQLLRIGIKVFEVVPPAVDTELNPAGRAKRGGFRAGLSANDFVAAVMRSLQHDAPEIGFGMTAGLIHASRDELDQRFVQMNSER